MTETRLNLSISLPCRYSAVLANLTCQVLLILLVMFSSPAIAQVNLSSQTQVPLPKAFGEPRSVRVSGAVGSVSDSIPMVAPPGRRGLQPRLNLTYNSMGGSGIVGLGWSIGLGRVERWRGDGTPSLAPGDRYSYSMEGGSGELRDLDGDGIYRARIESVYRPFQKVNEGWGTHDGKGLYYSFGALPESRIDGELWLLDQVVDPHGNAVTYHYSRECELANPGLCSDTESQTRYINEIRYTAHIPTGDPGANRIVFEYESRPDQRVSYLRGVREAKNLRVKKISVFAGNLLVRRYEMDYGRFNFGASLLEKVTLVGSDDSSRITLRTLAYGERTPGWNHATGTVLPENLNLLNSAGDGTGGQLTDVDSDGLADFVDNDLNVYLGNGAGNFSVSAAWKSSLPNGNLQFVNGDGINTGVLLLDVNGDGRPDLFIARPQSQNEVYLNTGTGWQKNDAWSDSLDGLSGLPVAYSDQGFDTSCIAPHCATFTPGEEPAGCTPAHCVPEVPGDDDTDPIPANPAGCSLDDNNYIPVHCTESSAHDGFFDANAANCVAEDHCAPPLIPDAPNATEKFAMVGDSGESKGVELADLNGDGLIDIAWYFTFTGGQFLFETPRFVRAVFLNGGEEQPGWHPDNQLAAELANLPAPFVSDNTYNYFSFQDVNGDGVSDIVRSIQDQQAVYLGNGSGWDQSPDFTQSMQNLGIYAADSEQKAQGLVPMDFNDDGLLDYVLANGESFSAYRNTGYGWTPDAGMAGLLEDLGIAFVNGEGRGTGTSLSDLDGDGIADLVTASGQEGSQNRIVLTNTLRSGKLVEAVSALGEVTRIEWGPSTRFDNTTTTGIQGLPFSMALAVRLSRSDGRGNAMTTDFEYGGGLFTNSSFRGFARFELKPSQGLRRESLFYQDEARATRILQVSAFDTKNDLRSRTTSINEVTNDGPHVQQVFLASTDTERFDPDGSSHTRVASVYDPRLQVVTIHRDAEVGPTGDERTNTFTWVNSVSAGIWGLPARARVLDATGELMSESITLYDGLAFGQASHGLPAESKDWLVNDEYVTRSFEYDDFGNPVVLRDREGNESSFEYDAATATFRVKAENALGHISRSEYDPRFGTLVLDTNASGNATTKVFDAFGRLSRLVLPGDEASTHGTTSYVYSPLGDPQQQFIHMMATENAGTGDVYESTNMFDAYGNVYETFQEGANGRAIVSEVEFRPDGQPELITSPHYTDQPPAAISTIHDDLGRPVSIIDPLGQTIALKYKGLDVESQDPRGVSTLLSYTPDGEVAQIRQEVDGDILTSSYAYDARNLLVQVTDALGNKTRISYDGLGRRTRMEDPNTGTFEYFYDGEGRLVEQIGPDGKSLKTRYSATGNLLERILPDGQVQTFHYGGADEPNAVGKLVEIEDAAGTLRIAYDARGNVVERKRTVGDRTFVTGFTYDSLNRTRRVTYPDGFIVDYAYDDGGNLASITDSDGRALADQFNYSAEGRITDFRFGNDVTTDYTYDDLGRMVTSVATTDQGTVLQDLVFGFDAANNVTALDDLVTGNDQHFVYDEISRLVAASGSYGDETYEYDAIGNLLRKGSMVIGHDDPLHPQRATCAAVISDKKGAKGGTKSIDPCAAHLSAVDPKSIARAFAIQYDSRGNVASKGDLRFEYDGENRLANVFEPNGSLIQTNQYDVEGDLVVRNTREETRIFIDGLYEEGQTHVSRHVYAGPLLIATLVRNRNQVTLIETAMTEERPRFFLAGMQGSGILLISILLYSLFGGLIRRIAKGLTAALRNAPVHSMLAVLLVMTSWSTGSFAKNANDLPQEQRYYYHANHLGSVNVVTDDEGRVTARRDYRPFGEPFDWSGAQAGPRELLNTFQGQQLEDTTGLYYFKARHYDSELGRFMSADTIVTDIGDPRTLHRYAFVGGNPVTYIDPTGRGFFSFLDDVEDFFTETLPAFVEENLVEVLVIVGVGLALVALTVFTGGIGTAILLGAAAGFVVGATIATAAGYSVTDSQFWSAGVLGAGLGALTAVALVSIFGGFGVAAFAGFKGGFLVGAAAGGLEQAVAGLVAGSSIEELWADVGTGVLVGGIIGGLTGGTLGKAGASLSKFTTKSTGLVARGGASLARGTGHLVKFIFEPGATGTAAKLIYAGVVSSSGRALTLFGKENRTPVLLYIGINEDAAVRDIEQSGTSIFEKIGEEFARAATSPLSTSPGVR